MHRAVGADPEVAAGVAPIAWFGGALGGVLGSIGFGAVMWLDAPAVIRASIPALYGLEPTDVGGWTIHVVHGVLLGLSFAFLVTRHDVAGWLTADVETDALDQTGSTTRLVLAGLVFGLTIWAVLPLLVMPTWLGVVGAQDVTALTDVAVPSLAGHLLFGLLLGFVYAVVVTRA